jgi:hypothetical protein
MTRIPDPRGAQVLTRVVWLAACALCIVPIVFVSNVHGAPRAYIAWSCYPLSLFLAISAIWGLATLSMDRAQALIVSTTTGFDFSK